MVVVDKPGQDQEVKRYEQTDYEMAAIACFRTNTIQQFLCSIRTSSLLTFVSLDAVTCDTYVEEGGTENIMGG